MNPRLSQSRVKGFLRVDGTRTLNEDNEEIILVGPGIGNWLLQEGYMWRFKGNFDRPYKIEHLVQYLAGDTYAKEFWNRFRENFVMREDIECMAKLGFNSVRIPFSWTILLENEPGVKFREDGFKLIDRVLDWCEEFKIYAILDLHGAHGGQTGSNIDGCIDDLPRLFTDPESRELTLLLWEEIARRYKDRWVVAAYDFLNEPLRTEWPNKPSTKYLLPELIRFYEDCSARVRAIDSKHAFSIEGANWATRTDTFTKQFDNQMIIHFHRYGVLPGEEAYSEWLDLSKKLNSPIWLGETGENCYEWYSAMYPLCTTLGIGYNFWTWKKLGGNPGPLSLTMPKGWDKIVEFTAGGPRPTYDEAIAIFDDFLEKIKIENCEVNESSMNALYRKRKVKLMASDFDTESKSCSGLREKGNAFNYRASTGMCIKERQGMTYERGPGFNCGWEKLCLELTTNEWVTYTLHEVQSRLKATISGFAADSATLVISTGDQSQTVSVSGDFTEELAFSGSGTIALRLTCTSGLVDLYTVELNGI